MSCFPQPHHYCLRLMVTLSECSPLQASTGERFDDTCQRGFKRQPETPLELEVPEDHCPHEVCMSMISSCEAWPERNKCLRPAGPKDCWNRMLSQGSRES